MPEATSPPYRARPDRASLAVPDLDHRLRADARRNRVAILAAAEDAFGTEGPDARMDEIARRAGVGVGTLYRHFPTKKALLTAVVGAHFEPLVAEAREALRARDPGAAFFSLVHHLAVEMQAWRALAEGLRTAGLNVHAGLQPNMSTVSRELLDATGALLALAQDAGQVRRDVSVTDVATIVMALYEAEIIAQDPARFLHCVDLVCDGLRTVR